ncbi:MAG: hypothetical protein IJZ82_06295 [Lachnospiraceae bacterium]|nr:hypothetical protein [Lachnospiraceae bacterium]
MVKNIWAQKCSKRVIFIILGLFAVIFLILGTVIAVIGHKNVKAMNSCIDAALEEIKRNYTVTPCDAGEYKEMKIYGVLKFHVEQYDIEELGNLSVMRVNMGIMQMATVVITPRDRNMPLLSADYMYILGNRKCYLEFYDVVKEKDEQYCTLLAALSQVQGNYEHLENIATSPAWYEPLLTVTAYKAGDSTADQDLQGMLVDSLETYLTHSKKCEVLKEEAKKEKAAITLEYTDGLIEKGGISTDVFKNALGDAETKRFFDCVFFGTATR